MIIYFSGLGNTRRVVQMLASRLGDTDVRECTAEMLRNPAGTVLEIEPADYRVVWAFPTYSWGVPPVVAELMKRASFGPVMQRATHYMLTTCGDDAGNIDRQWRAIMHRRGLSTAGAFSVIMPNTYVCMKGFDVDAPEVVARKLDAAPAAVEAVADAIERNASGILVRGSFPALKTAVVYPWFKRYAMSSKPFHSTEGCISCGKCAASCPMKNIEMRGGRPAWGSACAMCLRCYHICPRHAVAYGKATEGKGQYILAD